MTLVHVPERKHSCDIDWETREFAPGDDAVLRGQVSPGVRYAYPVHRNDPPGTVRRCGECGRCWVAERNQPGTAGVFWRPERRRERRKREKGKCQP